MNIFVVFLQLLSVYGENSPIAGFFKKNPAGGIHHICIEVRQNMENIHNFNVMTLQCSIEFVRRGHSSLKI